MNPAQRGPPGNEKTPLREASGPKGETGKKKKKKWRKGERREAPSKYPAEDLLGARYTVGVSS